MTMRVQLYVSVSFLAGLGLGLLLMGGVEPAEVAPVNGDKLVLHIIHVEDQLADCKDELVWLKAEPEPDCSCVPIP